MKIKVDDQEIFILEEWEKKVIKDSIASSIFEEDMKRRLEWVLKHKVEQCFKRMQEEWLPILMKDPQVPSIPASEEEFVNFVTSRDDYKDREERDKLME